MGSVKWTSNYINIVQIGDVRVENNARKCWCIDFVYDSVFVLFWLVVRVKKESYTAVLPTYPLNNQYHSTHATAIYHSYLVAANTINFSQWVTYRMKVLLTSDSIQIKIFPPKEILLESSFQLCGVTLIRAHVFEGFSTRLLCEIFFIRSP